MNYFPVGVGEYEASTSNSPAKSPEQRNISSDPDLNSLPSRVYECRCQVVVVQDLLQCGVVQLEGANRRAHCIFFGRDFVSRNAQNAYQKLSVQIPVGTVLLANARLMEEGRAIPFLATTVWEDGAIVGEEQVLKLFSSIGSQEIEQYKILSEDLKWFLLRDAHESYVDKHMVNHNRLDQSRSRSPISSHNKDGFHSSGMLIERPEYNHGPSRSPGYDHNQTKSRSPNYLNSITRSFSLSHPHSQVKSISPNCHPSRTKSRSPEYQHSHSRSKSPRYHHHRKTRSKSPSYYHDQTRIKNPRDHHGHTRSKSPKSHHSQMRSKSPTHHHSHTRSKSPMKNHKRDRSRSPRIRSKSPRSHNFQTRSKSPKYDSHRDRRSNSYTGSCNYQPRDHVKTAIETLRQDRKKESNEKVGYQPRDHVKNAIETLRRDRKKDSTIKKEINEKVMRSENKDKKETSKREERKATKENAGNDLPNSTSSTTNSITPKKEQLENLLDKKLIKNGKGKIVKILNGNYGIAIVLGFGRLSKVLFDICDVWIGSQVCAEMGKTLNDVMQEGDLVNLHAIHMENSHIGPNGDQIEYMATAVVIADSILNLLNNMFPANVHPLSPEEVAMISKDKIDNFHQVAKVALDMQEDGSLVEKNLMKTMKKDEIADENGILWKETDTCNYVSYFCFHCKEEHNERRSQWEAHNKHIQNCKGSEIKNSKCLERGVRVYQQMKRKQNKKMNNGHQNKETKKEKREDFLKVLSQTKELNRLVMLGSAGRNDSNKCCFHCDYEGPTTDHFTSKEHQDHVKDCGTKILDCPENPKMSDLVRKLEISREVLSFSSWKKSLASSYHRYYCLHCKEPFTNKQHVGRMNHTLHMSKHSCVQTCKMILLEDEKYVPSPGIGAKYCFICNVKLGLSKSIYKAHIRDTLHTDNVLNLLRKDMDGKVNELLMRTIKCEESSEVPARTVVVWETT